MPAARAIIKLQSDGVVFDFGGAGSTFVTSQQFIDGLAKSNVEKSPTRQGTTFYKHTDFPEFNMLNGHTFTDTGSTAKTASKTNYGAISEVCNSFSNCLSTPVNVFQKVVVWDPSLLEVALAKNQALEVTARLQLKTVGGDSDVGIMLVDSPGVSDGTSGGGNFIGASLHDLANLHCILGFDDSVAGRRGNIDMCRDNTPGSGSGSFEYTELKWMLGADMPQTRFTVAILSTGGGESPSSVMRAMPVALDPSNKLYIRLYSGNAGETPYEFKSLEVSVKYALHDQALRFSDPMLARSPLFIGGLRWTDPNYVKSYNGYTWSHTNRRDAAGAGKTVLKQTSDLTSKLGGYIPVLQPGAFNGIFPGAARVRAPVFV